MKLWLAAGAAVAVAVAAYFGSALWQARRSLEAAHARVAVEGQYGYRLNTLDRAPAAGFETISSPAQFRDAAQFGGRLYLCGASGLFAYDSGGALVAQFRAGLELPAAPLIALAQGAGANSGPPELWIATDGEGLLSYDGSRVLQVRADDARARAITALLPLPTGRIMLGTAKLGVLVWNGKTLAQLHPALAGLHVTALAGSEAGLWIGTLDRGALYWHAGKLDAFAEAEGVPDSRILSLAVNGASAFAGTALGVAEFRDGRFARVLAEGSLAHTLLARPESLALGTLEDGVIEVPLNSRAPRPRAVSGSGEFGPVQKLIESGGRVLALTETGLFENRAGGYAQVLERPGALLADGNISALAADRAGRLWVGYFDRGLDVIEPGFARARHVEDEHVFCVNRIVHAAAGGLTAAATANGLVLFDAAAQEKQVLGKAEGLIAASVTDVLLQGDGRAPSITVATPAGLTTLGPAGAASIYAFHGLVNNHAYALAGAGSRTLVGTLGGLSILDAGAVRASYTTANSGLRHNWITALVADGNGWMIGTYGAGVVRLDADGRWTSFPDLKAPLEINLNAMAVTERAVYAGTLGKGLAAYNRDSGRWTLLAAGLPSRNVTAVTAAAQYLYIGTDNGLVRVAERALALQ